MKDGTPEGKKGSDVYKQLVVFFAAMAAALAFGLGFVLYKSSRIRSAARTRFPPAAGSVPLRYSFFPLGGIRFEIRVWNRDLRAFIEDSEAAQDYVERLEVQLSTWRPDGGARRVNDAPKGVEVPLPPDLVFVLESAWKIAGLTGGAFNPAIGAATALWRRKLGKGRRPEPAELAELKDSTALDAFAFDWKKPVCRKTADGALLDLDGIAVGYIVDQVTRLLAERGITEAVVRAGRDVRVYSLNSSHKVAIENPLRPGTTYGYLYLSSGASATSGPYVRAFKTPDGAYGRVLDPRTLEPVRAPLSVTVLAPECMTADALATALLVLGPQRGLDLVEKLQNTEVMFLLEEGGSLRQLRSSGFPEVMDISRENQPFPPP